MKCAWRLAGAQRPAPAFPSPTASPHKPERRTGRFRGRLLLIPVLALLAGALFLLAAGPVAAQTKTFSITKTARATEGASASLTITLSEDAPGPGVAFTVGTGFGGSSTAEAADVMPVDSPVTVPGGSRTLRVAVPLIDDDFDEDEETFTVTIATEADGWTKEGDGKDTALVAIDDDDSAGVTFTGVNGQDAINQLPLRLNTPRTYRVVLTSRPRADVTIKTSARAVWVSPASHTFIASSADDWRKPKEFTVTGLRMVATHIWHSLTTADRKYASLADSDWDPSRSLQSYIDPPLPVTATPDRPALTAAFEGVPAEHDGRESFRFNLRFSEALGEGGAVPAAKSFAVRGGKVKRVRQLEPGLWQVRVQPKNWKDVTVTLAGGRACDTQGAVCAADGRMLSNETGATVGGPVRLRIAGGKAREGRDASIGFAVTLSRAAAHAVSVDYATADGTAKAGADYTQTSDTLTFAPGETAKTVTVAVLDDAIDEGKEKFLLKLSNPKGAYLRAMHREAAGVIVNDDPLQKMWLSRFGRAVGGQMVEALEGRFAMGPGAAAQVTVAGRALALSQAGDAKALADAMTGLAQLFGAPSAPAADGAFARRSLSGLQDGPAVVSAPARSVTGRELLPGSSFRFTTGDASGPGGAMTGWGKALSGGSSGSLSGGLSFASETATGVLGLDWQRGRLLFGVALSRSVETGSAAFAPAGSSAGSRYDMEGSLSMVTPYLRVRAGDRLSFWSAVGSGEGSMTLAQDGGVAQEANIAMRLAAAGGRAELLHPGAGGGFALALKADAFFVRTESARVSTPGVGNLAAGTGDASRVRALLEGSRSFALSGGGSLEPSLSVGVRRDGGDAETGSGVEAGAGLAWSQPALGLTSDLRFWGLAAHEAGGRNEWGASGSLHMAPGVSGRGLSLSLTPSWGVQGQSGRLWAAAPGALAGTAGKAEQPGTRLDTELGYGLSLSAGLTGTPYAGLGMSEGGMQDWRLGWRFASQRLQSLSLGVEATRSEAGAGKAEHGLTLHGAIRW